VGGFKRAISQLETINLSRLAALHFSPESGEAKDTTTITAADASAPGASPGRAFIIVLSNVTDGVAEPVLSQTEPGLVAYSEVPMGW
jgi:hypothetical protein